MKIKDVFNIIATGVVVGFVIGITISLKYIIANKYFYYKMFRLISLSFQDLLNKSVFYLSIGSILLCIIWFLFMLTKKGDKNKATRITVILCIILTGFLFFGYIFKYVLKIHTHYSSKLRDFVIRINEFVNDKISFSYLLDLFKKNISDIILVSGFIFAIIFLSLLCIKIIIKIKWENIFQISKHIKRIIRVTALCLVVLLVGLTFSIAIDNKINVVEGPNIIWILIDALRADHLGCYGYKKNTSPFIDSFAAKNILFQFAFSQESYTLASVPSFLTSTYPVHHKILYDYPYIDILDYKFLTLAEVLKNLNYNTAAFVFNPHLKARFNFDQGFDLYDDNEEGWDYSLAHHETFETARKIYDKLNRYLKNNIKRPVFLYLHYRDVHSPYAPPPPYHKLFLPQEIEPIVDIIEKTDVPYIRENINLWISQYDGEIRYTDSYIEKTLRMLNSYNINSDNSIIIITSDHGEEFLDYHPKDPGGRGHGRTLYMEQIHVPLIISIPEFNLKNRIIDSYVELIDILPTILEILDIEWGKYGQFQGRSLIPLMKGRDISSKIVYSGGNYGRGVIIENDWKYYFYDKFTKEGINAFSRRPPIGYKYIFEEELYNIKVDPNKRLNLFTEEKNIRIKLKERLQGLQKKYLTHQKARSVKIDKRTKEQLRSLGYIK